MHHEHLHEFACSLCDAVVIVSIVMAFAIETVDGMIKSIQASIEVVCIIIPLTSITPLHHHEHDYHHNHHY